MRDSSGRVMWAKFVYREIVPSERLVWVHSFSDENGGLTRHPLSPTWPLELLTTVAFEDARGGKTKLTLHWSPLNATAEERKTFDAAHDGMTQGWNASFDRSRPICRREIALDAKLRANKRCQRSNRQSRLVYAEAEEAAKFYVSVFENSRIRQISRYGEAGREVHGKAAGSVMVVEFEIAGQSFTALNGGPHFKFNEAISFQVMCDTQDEIDYFWSKLAQGGREGQYGWLKDKYGLSWQIVPSVLPQMLADSTRARLDRMMNAVMKMTKFDLETLKRAHADPA
jgi:predicted 3-demethylubiquinone-9 3-methyltransferase (glyoxalase superfamily)